MTEELLLKIYEFEKEISSQTEYHKKNNTIIKNSDYLCKNSNNYYIESWANIYDEEGFYVDEECYTYVSSDTTFESLKEFLIEMYGEQPLIEYRRKKLERLCK